MNQKRLALLRVARQQLGLDEDSYRAILLVQGGVESAKDLCDDGFERVMARFGELGFVSTARKKWFKPRGTNAAALVTPGQQQRLQALFGELAWGAERQEGFNRRMCKKAWPQTRAEANRVIEALKAMVARGYQQQS